MSCEFCTDPDGAACFPQYGLAPHSHEYDSAGRMRHGTARVLPRDQWPASFREEPAGSGHGVYWCPHCGDGHPGGVPERGLADNHIAEGARMASKAASEDFPLPPACPLRNEGDDQCEACQ